MKPTTVFHITRKALGLTLEQLSERSGVSAGILHRMDHGQYPAKLGTMHAVSDALFAVCAERLQGLGELVDMCMAEIWQERRSREQDGYRPHRQRNTDDSPYAALMVASYQERGLQCLHMPYGAPFDYVVNGHRIDAKASARDKSNRFAFPMPIARKHDRSADIPSRLVDRCDIVHCACVQDGSILAHYIIPAEAIGDRTGIRIAADFGHDQWFPWREKWELLQRKQPTEKTS